MTGTMRRTFLFLFIAAVAAMVYFVTREWYRPPPPGDVVSSTVLLERVKPVLKLVTVEGDFSELYTYRNAEASIDWLKQFSPFQKRAILRVKARASVGYDLDGMKLSFDEADRTVTLVAMGGPQLLSLEHDVDYYDLESGAFNAFTAADHTRISAKAKEMIRSKVEGSGLYGKAEAQRDEMLKVLRAVIENAGWKFQDRVSPVEEASRIEG